MIIRDKENKWRDEEAFAGVFYGINDPDGKSTPQYFIDEIKNPYGGIGSHEKYLYSWKIGPMSEDILGRWKNSLITSEANVEGQFEFGKNCASGFHQSRLLVRHSLKKLSEILCNYAPDTIVLLCCEYSFARWGGSFSPACDWRYGIVGAAGVVGFKIGQHQNIFAHLASIMIETCGIETCVEYLRKAGAYNDMVLRVFCSTNPDDSYDPDDPYAREADIDDPYDQEMEPF